MAIIIAGFEAVIKQISIKNLLKTWQFPRKVVPLHPHFVCAMPELCADV
jgi:hypothetical protein